MTYLSQLKNKKIVVLGAGITGLSCARFLTRNHLEFAINDSRENVFSDKSRQQFAEAICIEGRWATELISTAEIILLSPGIDIVENNLTQYISEDCEVMGDVELFCLAIELPILAVTGSNGKSTVVSLLAHIGNQLNKNVALGGNIGEPVLDYLDDNNKTAIELMVLELSSFQLETLHTMKATAATILNISDDHLDRHKTLDNYTKIKQRIYQLCDTAIVNRDDPLTKCEVLNKKLISFGSDNPSQHQFGIKEQAGKQWLTLGNNALVELDKLPLAGIHNALNYQAALALGQSANWSMSKMIAALPSFAGLPHRCQRVASNDDIFWVDDSKATNVGATLAAIEGLSPTILAKNKMYLIAGGEGKGADFKPLYKAINTHIAHVFTIGKDGQEIAGLTEHSTHLDTLEQAVLHAKLMANNGDTVLLSPACASLDMFRNFSERGKAFVAAVQEIKEVG